MANVEVGRAKVQEIEQHWKTYPKEGPQMPISSPSHQLLTVIPTRN